MQSASDRTKLGPHRSVESQAPRDPADAIVHSLVRPFFFSVEGESRRRRLLHARCPAPSAARHHPSITLSRSSAVSSSTSPTSLRRRSITGEGTRSNAAAMDAAVLELVHEPPELHPPPAPIRAASRTTTATSGCARTPGCFPAAFPPPTRLLRRAPVHTPL